MGFASGGRARKLSALMRSTAWAFAAVTAVSILALAAETGQEAQTLRLSAAQYRQIITDVFGPAVKAGGRFEPDIRYSGLLQVGASHVSVTAMGLEQYDATARSVAAQVVSEQHRATLIPCTPASITAPDDACARQFLGSAGRLLYRRALTEQELDGRVVVASESAKTLKDFYAGLSTSLATMLVSPQFLFRKQIAEPDPDHPGQFRMDGYTKASQLSFFLWNAAPDPQLLAAAESGALHTEKGLAEQVNRMIASPRLEAGMRAYFTDMFGFDGLETLTKDATRFPNFTLQVTLDAQEQTLRTAIDLLLTRHGDYRDLFTTRKTFLTPMLASIYAVPVAVPDGGWKAYEFAEGDPRAGLMMQVSFLALHSHPARTSPTLRGKALRELLLCQKVPDPPGNVDFTVVQDETNSDLKTARERLTAHRDNPACSGCHKITDPMGLAMENFDASGAFRTTENGVRIDASGELDGVKFTDGAGLGRVVHNNPAVPKCLVNRMYSYVRGRPTVPAENDLLKDIETVFAESGYVVPELMRRIAMNPSTYVVEPRARTLAAQ